MSYAQAAYAQSLAEFGCPLRLPQANGWLLQRPIPASDAYDAMGCYPLFACGDWSRLSQDLAMLGEDLVSLALVADPLGNYTLGQLHECFDRVLPFKTHYLIDLAQPVANLLSKNHQEKARRGLRQVEIDQLYAPIAWLEEWTALYANLIARHQLAGMQAFSPVAFAQQLQMADLCMFRARVGGETVGATLWFETPDVGYRHLAAFSDVGYALKTSYALDWFAIRYFAARSLRWLHLGAGAGVHGQAADGLSFYKRGWSTHTRTAYFCSRIFDCARYAALVKATDTQGTTYFPAYRAGEFGK